MALRKPNLLTYGEYIEECSQLLGNAGDTESDYLIPYFIRLQQFAEEVNHAFEYDTSFHQPQLDSVRVEILLKNFQQQLNQMEATFPPEIWNNSEHNTRLLVKEIPNEMSSYNHHVILHKQSLLERSRLSCKYPGNNIKSAECSIMVQFVNQKR
jgi:hypothetical protein